MLCLGIMLYEFKYATWAFYERLETVTMYSCIVLFALAAINVILLGEHYMIDITAMLIWLCTS